MSQQAILLGAAPTGAGGDTPRSAFGKVQANFDEVYAALGATGSPLALPVALPVAKGGTGNTTGTAQKLAAAAILGPVGQSGGVPTGAIIETGSNANGTYIKYADGTMICHRRLSIATPIPIAGGQLFYAPISTVSYAATFVGSIPTCQLSSEDNNGLTWATFGSGITLAVFPSFFIMAPVSVVSRGYTINMVAIGRWF